MALPADIFEQTQVDSIAEALQELMASEDDCAAAHKALVLAIDYWLNYHQSEMDKWKALRRKVGAD